METFNPQGKPDTWGRTIRKVMGGDGEKTKKKIMQGKMPRKKFMQEEGKEKNSCRRKVHL